MENCIPIHGTTRHGFLAGAGAVATTSVPTITLTYEGAAARPEGVPVSVKRDGYGVPHVFARGADGRAPVFFGYGFAGVEDRLFQLEMYMRRYHARLPLYSARARKTSKSSSTRRPGGTDPERRPGPTGASYGE